MRGGSLVWTTLAECSHNHYERVGQDAERSGPKDNGCDGRVNRPEVLGERASEEQERKLEHDGQGAHHILETPPYDPVHFQLTMLASLNS